MMGTRGISSLLKVPGSWTLVGLSAMFIRVALTIWLFTVYWVVPPILPAPASRSLMKREHIFPFLITSEASLYLCLTSLAGSPALPDSSSPADMTIGLTPRFWKVFPCPFPPQTPKIRGTLILGSSMKFLATCTVSLSKKRLGDVVPLGGGVVVGLETARHVVGGGLDLVVGALHTGGSLEGASDHSASAVDVHLVVAWARVVGESCPPVLLLGLNPDGSLGLDPRNRGPGLDGGVLHGDGLHACWLAFCVLRWST